MGICASCLGLNRHPSQKESLETDRLLSISSAQYGTVEEDDIDQPDEEEARREREALEQITVHATDNMIDVAHPNAEDFGHHFARNDHDRDPHHDSNGATVSEHTSAEQDTEDAWLQSVRAGGSGEIEGLRGESLVMDLGQLRQDSSTPKKTQKAVHR